MTPQPLIRFDQVRQLDTFDTTSDEERFARGRYFFADCAAADEVGHFVFSSAVEIAGVRQVARVDVTDRLKVPAIGVIISKPASTSCLVQTFGEIPASGLTPPSRFFIGTDGKITATAPVPAGAGTVAIVQVVGIALASDRFFLSPNLSPVIRTGD